MSEKLKPCAYCRAQPSLENLFGMGFQVQCGCGACGPMYPARAKVAGMWPKDAARKAWNSGKTIEVTGEKNHDTN